MKRIDIIRTGVSISKEARRLWLMLARRPEFRGNASAVVEQAIREMAERRAK